MWEYVVARPNHMMLRHDGKVVVTFTWTEDNTFFIRMLGSVLFYIADNYFIDLLAHIPANASLITVVGVCREAGVVEGEI